MKTTITRLFQNNEAAEAARFTAATNGTMSVEGNVFVVTCTAGAAAKAAAVVAVDKTVEAGVKTILGTGKAAAMAVDLGAATTKVAIKSATPVGAAIGKGVIGIGAAAINTTAKITNDVKTTWKEDASVIEARKEVKDAYATIKNSVPKEISFFGITLRR